MEANPTTSAQPTVQKPQTFGQKVASVLCACFVVAVEVGGDIAQAAITDQINSSEKLTDAQKAALNNLEPSVFKSLEQTILAKTVAFCAQNNIALNMDNPQIIALLQAATLAEGVAREFTPPEVSHIADTAVAQLKNDGVKAKTIAAKSKDVDLTAQAMLTLVQGYALAAPSQQASAFEQVVNDAAHDELGQSFHPDGSLDSVPLGGDAAHVLQTEPFSFETLLW